MMMKKFKKYYFLLLLTLLWVACKESYRPEVTVVNSNILVVEGMINTGADSTIIKLSRTVTILNKISSVAEKGANVKVESETNETYPLVEKTPGSYEAPAMGLSSAKKYRIRITTAKNIVYLSDFVTAKVTPPIDNITWEAKEDGIQFYVDTHDPNNNSTYYKWEYVETWKFHSLFLSRFISNGTKVVPRDMINNDVYTCWAGSTSKNILIASSLKLNQDVIHQQPLGFVGHNSQKLEEKYTILLKQSVLTKEAFDFWQDLKKNTESLGSIFDAQPSQLTGNVKNMTNPNEPVIGYVSAGTTQQKRIYVTKDQLPDWRVKYPYSCKEDSIMLYDPVLNLNEEDYYFHTFKLIPTSAITTSTGTVLGHFGAPKECVDCTIRGTTKPPSFWQ